MDHLDEKTRKHLDESVKKIQLSVISMRCQVLGPNQLQEEKITAYLHSIALLNQGFHTNYMDYKLRGIKLTDSNGMVKPFVSKLPLKQGDEAFYGQ